jgi:hypothetical protein
MRHFILAGVLNEASGRPYTGVLDTSEPNFSLVPGEGYNSFTGPGLNDLDVNITRDFHFGERYVLRLRLDVFDLLNHANYTDTVNNVQYVTSSNTDNVFTFDANPQFGQPLATFPQNGERNMQFSTRFTF